MNSLPFYLLLPFWDNWLGRLERKTKLASISIISSNPLSSLCGNQFHTWWLLRHQSSHRKLMSNLFWGIKSSLRQGVHWTCFYVSTDTWMVLKLWSRPARSNVNCELVRNTHSWAPPQTWSIRILGWQSSDVSGGCWSLRIVVLCIF